MKKYTVVSNTDGTSWTIKSDQLVLKAEFPTKDEAILAAEKLAVENSPSSVEILDGNNRIEHNRKF